MLPCPICATALDRNEEVLFCPGCRSSLQPRASLAVALDLPAESPELDAGLERGADPVGRCPGCGRGTLAPAVVLGERVARCAGCGALWMEAGRISAMRSRLARTPARVATDRPDADYAERFAAASRFRFDDPKTNAIALPAAMLVGVMAHVAGAAPLMWATVQMWFHELGHAVVAWLGGFIAVPLPFFTVTPRDDRSPVVVVLVLAMIGAIAFDSARRRRWALVAFAAVLLAMQVVLTWGLNPAQSRQWFLFAGEAGAIVFPTLVLLAFYEPMGWRWDFWRFPAGIVAAVGLVHALFIWIGVARGTAIMPHGSAVGEASEGDMERLVATYHWSQGALATAYLALAIGCLVALTAVYLVRLRGGAPAAADG
jgi:hypothetical protein